MTKRSFIASMLVQARRLVRQTLLVVPLSLMAGTLVALFLWLLDAVTQVRWQRPWLMYGLPLAGVLIHLLYRLWGRDAERGNNLIIDEIHEPGGGVPARMAPLVLLTTLITHLFGGSAGREGTAVQVGGSVAGYLGRKLRLGPDELRLMLMSGIAAGFGAVFGTPVAGAIFALEVLVIGKLRTDALWPCLVAGFLGDAVCSAWGIVHTGYAVAESAESAVSMNRASALLAGKILLAGAVFGLASRAFSLLTRQIKKTALRLISIEWLIPFTGGCMVLALVALAGTTDYLGLGVVAQSPGGVSIVNAFRAGGVDEWSWCWKLVFTAVTIGTGFKGGEVTPLFFIGAALGHSLALWLGAPVDLFAALGFIAVFAGATNTPVACTVMGIELFGSAHAPYYALACLLAYGFSGKQGIYTAQRHAGRDN